jgi:NADH dehydrogenase (ubiquinone) Fe-S protein 4
MAIPEVLIYQPSKNAMQAGTYKSGKWFMKFVNYKELDSKYVFDIMNWNGSKDTLLTINMEFESLVQATHFAEKCGFKYTVSEGEKRIVKPKSYTSNFV